MRCDITDSRLCELTRGQARRARELRSDLGDDAADMEDLVLALQELEERRKFDKGAPLMSKSGDWALAIVLLAVFLYAGYLVWSNW